MAGASLACDELELLIEIADTAYLEPNAALWDTAVWDGDTGSNWSSGFGVTDRVEDLRGFILERGRQTVWDDLQGATLNCELDNTDGQYSVYGENSYPRIFVGAKVLLNGKLKQPDGTYRLYRLFTGKATNWQETASPDPGASSMELTAVDAFRDLAEPISGEYNPGVPYQIVSERIHGLLDRRPEIDAARNIRFGTSTLTNYLTSRTLLDEIKVSAMSDGGWFFIDNDGTICYFDRSRLFGRPREGGALPPIFGDDCALTPDGDYAELPYAAIEPVVADKEFANVVMVSNVSQGNDSPQTVVVADQTSIDVLKDRFMWSPPQLPIMNADHVQGYAEFELDYRRESYYRIDNFTVYPAHDPKQLWPVLLSMRVGDSLFVRRRPPNSTMISQPSIMDGMRIEATPSLWKAIIRCSPGTKIDIPEFWDYSLWDVGKWL